jgi:hypothetical protein
MNTRLKMRDRIEALANEAIAESTFLTDPNHPNYFWNAFPEIDRLETYGASSYNDGNGTDYNIYLRLYRSGGDEYAGVLYYGNWGKKVHAEKNDIASKEHEESNDQIIDRIESYLDLFIPILEILEEVPGSMKITRDGFSYSREIEYEYLG